MRAVQRVHVRHASGPQAPTSRSLRSKLLLRIGVRGARSIWCTALSSVCYHRLQGRAPRCPASGGDGASAPTTTPSLGCGGPLERPLAQTTLWPPQPPVTPRRTTPRPRSPAPHLSSRTPRATRRHRLCGRWRSGLVRRPRAGPAAFHADSREQPRLGSIGHPARHPAGRHVLDTDTPHRPDDRGRRLFGGVPPDRSHSGMDPGEARHRPTPDYGARHVAALVLIVEPGLSP